MSLEPKPRTKGYWENIKLPPLSDNYPTRTAQDLEIADLKRENNAAFQRIQELSDALYQLGYDPTAKVKAREYEEKWIV
jgi:hypothetical protein